MVANDIGRDLLRITDSRHVLWINGTSVLAVTCLSMLIALGSLESYLLDWNYLSFAVRGGGVFLPMTVAVFGAGRLTAFWAILSMIASTAAAIAAQFVALPINPLFAGLIVSAALVAPGILHSATVDVRASRRGR